MKQFNSFAAMEEYIRSLHPEKMISVISDKNFYYVEEPGQLIRTWETLIFEGLAKNFNH